MYYYILYAIFSLMKDKFDSMACSYDSHYYSTLAPLKTTKFIIWWDPTNIYIYIYIYIICPLLLFLLFFINNSSYYYFYVNSTFFLIHTPISAVFRFDISFHSNVNLFFFFKLCVPHTLF